MDPMYSVKEEYAELGGSRLPEGPPRPMEGLHEAGPAAFLVKTYDMVDDSNTDGIVSWSRGGWSFVVWDTCAFAAIVLPRYFKHNNFSSFVRQLNTYGFRKIDSEKWEFANESFLQGQKHLIRNIRRRKGTSSHPHAVTGQSIVPCFSMDKLGQDENRIHRLRRDKEVLMMEILKLRQQQQNARAYLQQMDLRLKHKEKKQQQMMRFLSRAVSNPDFINQLLQHKEKRKEVENRGESSRVNRVKLEPLDYNDDGFQVSELEALALEIQGFGRGKRETEEEREVLEWLGSENRELDEGFWRELLSEGFDDDNNEGSKDENLGDVTDGWDS